MQEVEAVKSEQQREQVETRLIESGQIYLDIWRVGINTALRISDLLLLTMQQVRDLDADRPMIPITEKKTGKRRDVHINARALEVMQRRLSDYPDDVWLFQSSATNLCRRQAPRAITARSVGRVFQSVGEQVRPRVQLGTHSMRKTRGYFMHSQGIAIEQICHDLNHSHPAVTMRYIGLTQEDSERRYQEFML